LCDALGLARKKKKTEKKKTQKEGELTRRRIKYREREALFEKILSGIIGVHRGEGVQR